MPVKKNVPPKKAVAKKKVEKVMKEWKNGELHSGSKTGPKVTSQKQAIAIGLSEAKKAVKGKKATPLVKRGRPKKS
jgi:hypothetical protein